MIDLLEQDSVKKIIRSSDIKTFGFIIYNDENSNIVKLLRDEDHWTALSKASGERFYIFAVKPKEGSRSFPDIPSDTLGMILPIWKEPEDNNQLLEIFEISSTEKLPLFFIFTKVDSGIWKYNLHIDDSNVDTALKQLKILFRKIRDLSEKIHKNYQEDPTQVHERFKEILQKEKFKRMVYDATTLFGAISKIGRIFH